MRLSIPQIDFRHPNILDRFLVKVYSRYLYPGQPCLTVATTNVGVIHKSPDITSFWKIMDYVYLSKNSALKYAGLARNLNMPGDIPPLYSVFQLITPIVDEIKSRGKSASPGDLIAISPYDRQFIAGINPEILSHIEGSYKFPDAEA